MNERYHIVSTDAKQPLPNSLAPAESGANEEPLLLPLDRVDLHRAGTFHGPHVALSGPCGTTLPFAHLNLRQNPFGELTVEELTALAYVNIDDVVPKLSQPHFAVQFVGEKGFGKTTHLLAVGARFPGARYVHIPEGEHVEIQLQAASSESPLLIDEAQRLTWRQRCQVFRWEVPLVLGTHVDYQRPLVRAGRVVQTVAVDRNMNAERLCALLNARIHRVRRGAGRLPQIRIETARRLLQQCGPNVRHILHELYVTFQSLSRVQDV